VFEVRVLPVPPHCKINGLGDILAALVAIVSDTRGRGGIGLCHLSLARGPEPRGLGRIYDNVLDHGFFRFAQWPADPPLSHKINL